MPKRNRSAEEEKLFREHGADFLENTARSLKVLTFFGRQSRRLTLSDVAKALDLPRATVRRTLHTLTVLEYLSVEGNTFGLTPKVLTFANAYLSSDVVPVVMQPLVDKLSDRLNESCAAAVLQGANIVMVARASPARALALDMRVGFALPAYCSALGRALLTGLNDAEAADAIGRMNLVRLTPLTITDESALLARIAADRVQGYSLVDQEAEMGYRSIAVPVRQAGGAVRCALHVGVHTERASLDQMTELFLPSLVEIADQAGTMLI